MADRLEKILYQVFGHKSFHRGQKEAISSALEGKDTLVILPTGSGKSICYQIFPYLKTGTTIIISPLLSLMQDQADKLREYGIKEVCAINSMLTIQERKYILKHLDTYKFILVSPEMLKNNYLLDHLTKLTINLLVVDEAHCVSQWGMDFRPDYLNIKNFRAQINHPPIMALTATAPRGVQIEIKNLLGFREKRSETITASVDRPEIKLYFERTENKDQRLIEIVEKIVKPGIIYFSSKKKADAVSDYINEHLQLRSECYHADKENSDKTTILNQFLDNQLDIVCATSAFGMGLNKPDVKFVIHYHMPASPEMYLQEIGRCSRNGKPGLAILLYSEGDEGIQHFLRKESIPDPSTVHYVFQKYNEVQQTDDVLFKLIEYFYLNDFSVEETIQFFNERKRSIHSQINYLMDLIFTRQCKREFLLEYFGEPKNDPVENCCLNCQDNLLESFFEKEPKQANPPGLESYKEVIKRLYKLDLS